MKLIRKTRKEINKSGNRIRYAIFECPDCLQEVERNISNGKKQNSCGCDKKYVGSNNPNYKHGESNSKLYAVWFSIKQRVLNPNNKSFKDYGGRGITICNEWLEFITFRDWSLSNGYAEGLQINRINNNDNYEPNNCNFVTSEENARNKRNNVIESMEMANEIRELWKTGEYTKAALGRIYGVSPEIVYCIVTNKYWKPSE